MLFDPFAKGTAAMSETVEPETRPRTPYDMAGGETGLKRMVEAFYDIMDSDPAMAKLRAMHAPDLGPMREKLFDWLSGWMGGPQRYSQRPDAGCVVSAHRPFAIDAETRDQWMDCMRRAFVEAGLTEDVRKLFDGVFARIAESFRNR